MVGTVDLTRPTVEMLADPKYRHPYFSMFPPTRAQIREAFALRKKRVIEATKAKEEAHAAAAAAAAKAEKEAQEKAAAEAAEAAAKAQAEKEAKEKEAAEAAAKEQAGREAEAAAAALAAAAAERTAKQVQQLAQTDLGYCYHSCPGHRQLEQPFIKGKLGCECQSKKVTEKSAQKSADKSDEKQSAKDSKKDQKLDTSKDAAEESTKGKPAKDKQDKAENQEKQPKGILKEAKQSKDAKSSEMRPVSRDDLHPELPLQFGMSFPDPSPPAYTSTPDSMSGRQVHFREPSIPPPGPHADYSDVDIPFRYMYRRPMGQRGTMILDLKLGADGKMYNANGTEIVVRMEAPEGMCLAPRDQPPGSNLVASAADFSRPLHDVSQQYRAASPDYRHSATAHGSPGPFHQSRPPAHRTPVPAHPTSPSTPWQQPPTQPANNWQDKPLSPPKRPVQRVSKPGSPPLPEDVDISQFIAS